MPNPIQRLPDIGMDRDQLILEHLPLLHHLAGRMVVDAPGCIDREDLAGYGMIGLISAADSWDAGRGLKFSTYAYPKIRGAILDELRRQDALPRGRREKVRDLDRAVAKLEQAQGLPPSPEQIAKEMGLGLDEVDEILVSARFALSTSLDEGPSSDLSTMLEDPRSIDPVGSAEWAEAKKTLAQVIQELPKQERTVVALYYGEELLLKEIGEILGVTESRVSQIHSRALYRLNLELKEFAGSS